VRREPAFARAYARALFDLARERDQVGAIARELAEVARLVAGVEELRQFFARPWVSAAAKRRVAMDVATAAQLSPLMRNFVGLVARQGRADQLDVIASAYEHLVDASEGRVRARVRTAVPLTDAERAGLRERLARALTRQGAVASAGPRPLEVVLEDVVDAQVIGGFVAEIGSYIVDGSLNGQLARLKDRLASA
jgi:F-type H+-transporting ATPase subunit delta